jgi:predicted phosphohydrolase
MSLYALADLHLSLAGDKPMDVFGEQWRDHPARMAEAWDRMVGPDDTVLLPGDLSWGRTLDEAAPDLAWIGARPGRKVLLRGNHDSWWTSLGKVERALPAGCVALQNSSLAVEGWVVIGARGWVAPGDPAETPTDAAVFRRELERLRLAVRHADETHGRARPRLAMTHFPPWLDGAPPTEVVPILREAAVRVCVYGHLHGADHVRAVRGERDGMLYVFAAADAVGFAPVALPDAP